MKILAETTGEFMINDLSTGDALYSSRPGVIELSPFIESRIAINQIRKVEDVPDEATDAEFEAFWRDSDGKRDLAIDSFLSKFAPAAPVAKKGK
jgi:hypothetical protein